MRLGVDSGAGNDDTQDAPHLEGLAPAAHSLHASHAGSGKDAAPDGAAVHVLAGWDLSLGPSETTRPFNGAATTADDGGAAAAEHAPSPLGGADLLESAAPGHAPQLPPVTAHLPAKASSMRAARRAAHGQRIVVFLVANSVAPAAVHLAMALARPCMDAITLCTVAAREEAEAEGRAMLEQHRAALASASVPASCLVLVKGPARGLLECMQEAVDVCGAGLVSAALMRVLGRASVWTPRGTYRARKPAVDLAARP